ncbi:MAG: hypothetical protein ABIE47_02080 [Pseudomonadota bacterium]
MPQAVNDPYETRRPWEEWDAQQEAALDAWGFDWAWYEKNRKEEEE